MMTDSGALQVIVVDDVVRFALHVWRYLDRSLGFGIGAVPAGEAGRFVDGEKVRPLPTADRSAAVWWLPANPRGVANIAAVEKETGEAPRLYLIDVKSPDCAYLKAVLEWRDRKREADPAGGDPIRFVSSYVEDVGFQVWPKSPATLQWVASQVRTRPPPREAIGALGHLDVLVTGAGFELRPRPWLGSAEGSAHHLGFGLPDTAHILETMSDPFTQTNTEENEERVVLQRSAEGFPLPLGRPFSTQEPGGAFQALATEGRLDEWWDLLLETELQHRLQPTTGTLRDRRKAKGVAWEFEKRMREAFRASILRHDWGHLGQALAAARLPWCAWLSTNYTRFADRAIALTAQARHRELARRETATSRPADEVERRFEAAPSWRLVATAQEARLLIRELQDREDEPGRPLEGTPLFKLHGDISHLQTMAIAGHDKELFSALSVPVDNLYQVYDAAEKFLLRLVREHPGRQLRFHVVGHGLKDATLVSVLARVAAARSWQSGREPILRLVAPSPPSPPDELAGVTVEERVEMAAESYMASLGPARRPES